MVEFTEGWLVAFRDRIGEYASYEPHTFYWLTPQEYEGSPCPDGSGRCAFLFLDEDVTPGFGYETVGRFSWFIIDCFGMDRYFELYNGAE